MPESHYASGARITMPFFIVMLGFLTVCITLIVYYNYRNSDRLIENEISGAYIDFVEEKSQRLGDTVAHELALFENLLRHENVGLLLTRSPDPYTKAALILDWRAQVVQQTHRSYISNIYVHGTDNRRFYSNDLMFPLRPAYEKSEWYEQASDIELGVHWYGVVPSGLRGGSPLLFGARKIYSSLVPPETTIGVAYVSLTKGLISGVASDLEIDGTVHIVDSAQRILYSTDGTGVGQHLSSLDIGVVLQEPASYAIRRESRPARMVIVSSSNAMGWRLIHERPYIPLMSRFRQNRFLLYSIVSWAAVAMIAFLMVLRSRVSLPLARLHRKMVEFMKPGTVDAIDVRHPTIKTLDRDVIDIMKRVGNMQRQSAEAEARSRIEELRRIQAQISPHFLWRVLNNVRFLVMMGERDRVVRILDELFGLLKSSLAPREELVSLEEEIQNLRRYVTIVDAIYEGVVDFHFDLDPSINHQKVPSFILQPIVENSIYHGIDPNAPGSRISVSSSTRDGMVWLVIEDNGIGMEKERTDRLQDFNNETRTGLGLASVDRKLKLHFGNSHGISIRSGSEGTSVSMRIPLQVE